MISHFVISFLLGLPRERRETFIDSFVGNAIKRTSIVGIKFSFDTQFPIVGDVDLGYVKNILNNHFAPRLSRSSMMAILMTQNRARIIGRRPPV